MAKSNDMYEQVRPPAAIKNVYKKFQRLKGKDLTGHPDVIDLAASGSATWSRVRQLHLIELPEEVQVISEDFLLAKERLRGASATRDEVQDPAVFEVTSIPGLLIYPSLLSPEVQLDLLNKLLHRDLCNPEHKTNIHLHYDVPYPTAGCDGFVPSYFDPRSRDLIFVPEDSAIHKPLTTRQVLNKKLRWITLGGQYDWTNKVYPPTAPPSFPRDLKSLIESLFPMNAEAAIVNLYSPGDTLSLHQDVSEHCDQPLVSISLGCDGIFVVGIEEDGKDASTRIEVIRLRSGDAVLMSGLSRYAWHGVPKVIESTCPAWMEDWPFMESRIASEGGEDRFADWKGWMKGKRINLNVRQMFHDNNET